MTELEKVPLSAEIEDGQEIVVVEKPTVVVEEPATRLSTADKIRLVLSESIDDINAFDDAY